MYSTTDQAREPFNAYHSFLFLCAWPNVMYYAAHLSAYPMCIRLTCRLCKQPKYTRKWWEHNNMQSKTKWYVPLLCLSKFYASLNTHEWKEKNLLKPTNTKNSTLGIAIMQPTFPYYILNIQTLSHIHTTHICLAIFILSPCFFNKYQKICIYNPIHI